MLFILTGLGFGDEGKGATCHWLCWKYGAHTVVRTGGPQAYHTVVTADGKEHIFSQFGAGSLVGAATHLSYNMIVDPYAILNEGRVLVGSGIGDIFKKMTIDLDCLVITPFQAAANRLREIARGKGRYGTVGIGVGETICDSEQMGEEAIRVKDINRFDLSQKLENIRQLKIRQMSEIIARLDLSDELVKRQTDILFDKKYVEEAKEEFRGMAKFVRIVDRDYLKFVLKRPGNVVFESSQGILLDRWAGFHPYTTLVNPKQNAALELISEQGYTAGEMIRFGIMRGYQTRHGAGPFVTEDPSMLLPDIHNSSKHPWQGNFRIGHFDGVATKYAIEVSGGPKMFDGLVVNCLDRLVDGLKICDGYVFSDWEKDDLDQFFEINNNRIATAIKVKPEEHSQDHLNRQARLAQILANCQPILTPVARENFLSEIEKRLQIPVIVTAYGPTEKDRKITHEILSRVV